MLPLSTLLACLSVGAPPAGTSIEPNRSFEVLPSQARPREALHRAGFLLGRWTIDLAGVPVDGPRLVELAKTAPNEPITRVLREQLGRPIDLEDLLYFLDDLLRDGKQKRYRGRPIVLSPFRARSAGIFVHPDDVYRDRPRLYGEHGPIELDPIAAPRSWPPAEDHSPLGPGWTARFEPPPTEDGRLEALAAANPDFAARVRALVEQLKAAGATVEVESTVRSPERGLLIYGAFVLSRAKTARELNRAITRLEKDADEWGLSVPIRWRAPGAWTATRREAKRMAEAFNVVFASRRGARQSKHYEGRAVDLSAFNLPRSLTLVAPSGERQSFDLQAPEESRDLSLSPALVEWIELHFGLEKLRSDYPHWNDALAETTNPE